MAKREWKNLSSRQKRGILLGGTVQIELLAAALAVIYRRPREEIRGSKWMWCAASFANFVGRSPTSSSGASGKHAR